MADSKITALTSISTSTDPAVDPLVIVDVSDTSMAATGTTKKVTLNQLLGAGGTATLASATITGDLTVRTNKLAVTSTGVGLGTASPAVICDVTSIEADIAIFRSTTAGGNDKRLTITSGGDRIILNVSDNTNTATARAYVFQSAGTEVGRINTTGVYVLKGGTTTANGVGVAFPATQVASSDANCLDDYEEGTWTGTLKGSTTDPTVAVTATGRYTKIGRQVLVEISFTNVSTVGASGAISVAMTGLPGVTATRSMGNVSAWLGATFTGTLQAMIIEGTSVITLVSSISNAANGDATHNAGVGRYFWITASFTV
jgi:hypothetical protein